MKRLDKSKATGVFLVPTLFVLFLVLTIPLVYSFVVSFFDTNLKTAGLGNFVGIDNYISALKDEYFRDSIWTTAKFTIGVVIAEFLIGLIIALLLNSDISGKNIYFSFIIVPMMITPIAVGLTWRLLLHANLGIVNYVLGFLGVSGKAWLASPNLALGTVMFIDVWQQVPYMVLIILAGLITLPVEPYEAAYLDGANRIQTFFNLTVPMMLPTFTVVLLLRTISSIKTYDLIYVLTRGGPGTTTEVISYYIYQQAFRYTEIGQASAMSYILVLLIVPVAILFVKFTKSKMK